MAIVEYTVLVTFDLSYADSGDYRSVNTFLSSEGFEPLSHKGHKLPSNTYLGTESAIIGSHEMVADGAVRVKDSVYRSIKAAMNGSGLQSVVFVMVSPKTDTFYSCSKPVNF